MTQLLDTPIRSNPRLRPDTTPGTPADQWIVEAGGNRTLPPLLVFPHAGAGPSTYLRFARAFGGAFRPLIIHLPGRESRLDEPPCGDLPTLLRNLCRALVPLLSTRFVFYGHSMGALLAFELARHLRRLYGVEPDHLVVSGRAAPRVQETRLRYRLPDGQLWESICGLLGTPAEVAADPDMHALLLPILRADLQICDAYRYRPEPPLDCPISSFAGALDEEAPAGEMTGWGHETRSRHRHETMPGNHFFNLAPGGGFTARLLAAIG